MTKKVIVAAGGVVLNEKNDILFIFRRGFWDLPKGKLDDGETIEECATREVCEETGLINIQLTSHIKTTFHEYFDKWIGEEVIKETHWYLMKTTDTLLKPQISEDIEIAKWVSVNDLSSYLHNTYPSIKDVIESLSF